MSKADELVWDILEKKRTNECFTVLVMKADSIQEEFDLEVIAAPQICKPPKRFVGPAAIIMRGCVDQDLQLEYFKVPDTAVSQLSSRMEQCGMQSYNKFEQYLMTGEDSNVCSLYP